MKNHTLAAGKDSHYVPAWYIDESGSLSPGKVYNDGDGLQTMSGCPLCFVGRYEQLMGWSHNVAAVYEHDGGTVLVAVNDYVEISDAENTEGFLFGQAVIDGKNYHFQCCTNPDGAIAWNDCGYDEGSSRDCNDELASVVGWDGVLRILKSAHAVAM